MTKVYKLIKKVNARWEIPKLGDITVPRLCLVRDTSNPETVIMLDHLGHRAPLFSSILLANPELQTHYTCFGVTLIRASWEAFNNPEQKASAHGLKQVLMIGHKLR